MAGHHVAVALLPPPPLAAAFDVLRRSIGSSSLARIPPHLTLVPPVNVRDGDLRSVRRLLEDVAERADRFELRVGPAASFAPRTPTLHLEVRGRSSRDDEALGGLRGSLLVGPFDRPDQFPFTPHLTLEQRADPDRIAGAVTTIHAFDERWPVRSLHLLEHRRPGDRPPYWEPVLEAPLGAPVVVGRGGVELRLHTLGMLGAPDAGALGVEAVGPFELPTGTAPVVVTARCAGADTEPCGAAVGEVAGVTTARLHGVTVDEGNRGRGVGAQLLAAWCSQVAERGADVVVAPRGPGEAFLQRHGFVAVGDVMVRG